MSENLNNYTKLPCIYVRKGWILALFFLKMLPVNAHPDSVLLRRIYDVALTQDFAYQNLYLLCKEAPGRISGSPASEKAIELTARFLREAGADSVWLQPVQVPYWVRGEKERLGYWDHGTFVSLTACAIGNSIGTNGMLRAKVLMVEDLQDLFRRNREETWGKIIFVRKAPDPRHIDTFNAYGGCSGIRLYGADSVSSMGALALIMHAITLSDHDHPHTGTLIYKEKYKPVPGMILSPLAARKLEAQLLRNPELELEMELDCENRGMAPSYNVIAQMNGRNRPEEIVLAGAHLDSWDLGEGAHDDGAGVVHVIETLRLFRHLNLRPERSVRVVLFMNEENGAFGAEAYAEKYRHEKHVFALESDRGGFTPRGFTVETNSPEGKRALEKIRGWAPLFAPYLVQYFESGYSGVDVSRLRGTGCVLAGFIPDSQRYFDFHHAETDVVETVHPRELALGAATIASLVWLVAEYGLN